MRVWSMAVSGGGEGEEEDEGKKSEEEEGSHGEDKEIRGEGFYRLSREHDG